MRYRPRIRTRSGWPFALLALLVMVPTARADVASLRADVEALTSGPMEGRGLGTEGLDRAADYLESRLRQLSLGPAGSNGYRQVFRGPGGESLVNLIAVLSPPQDQRLAGHVVVGAHYDHLGRVDGRVHPGADDNASGVAALLAIAARVSAVQPPPLREIVFVLFSGEEAGLLGSRDYAKHPSRPLDQAWAMINLDTVGRLRDGRLTVFGTDTAREFEAILRGVNLGFGLDLGIGRSGEDASDHVAFQEQRVPALHLFTGPHADYHRPGDVAARIEWEGLEAVAGFTAELVRHLAERERPLTAEFSADESNVKAPAPPPSAPSSKRRVSFGSIPDFQYEGEGVRISGVLPASPAAEAGLAEGDVIVSFAGVEVLDLAGYSDVMKRHAPGDEVEVVYLRGGERHHVSVRLVARR